MCACVGLCERNRGVRVLDNVVEREKRGYRDTIENKVRERQKVKRQNELFAMLHCISSTADRYSMNKENCM